MGNNNSMGLPVRGGRTEFTFDSPEFQENKFGAVWLTDDPDGPLVAFVEVPPNLEFFPHSHNTDYVTVVIEGSLQVGRKWYRAGSVRVQEKGSVYGPNRIGPDGLKAVVFFADRNGFPDQPAHESDRIKFAEMLAQYARFARQEIPYPAPGSRKKQPSTVNA